MLCRLECTLTKKAKCDFCVCFEKESISLEEINCNNGRKCLSGYVDDFRGGLQEAFLRKRINDIKESPKLGNMGL